MSKDPAPDPNDLMRAAILDAFKSMTAEEKKDLLTQAGVVPTTSGLTPETMQTIMATMGGVSATAIRESLRRERKENPAYPEKSVFHPAGKFDDEGHALPPKATFARSTFFNGVRLGGELETEDEIQLCNRFTVSRNSRNGEWTATLEGVGPSQKLLITVPSKTVDDRMSLPPFTHILRELLEGAAAADPDALAKRVAELEAQMKAHGMQAA